MNLDPNSVTDKAEDEIKYVESDNDNQQEMQKRDENRLSEQINTPEAERGIPRDLSVRKISTMKKVAILVLGLFSVGLISAGVMRYGAGWFKKEPKPEQQHVTSSSPSRIDFSRSQKDRIASASDVESEVLQSAASEVAAPSASEPTAENLNQPVSQEPVTTEPPPDLRLTSPLMFEEESVAASVGVGGGIASLDSSSQLANGSTDNNVANDTANRNGLSERLSGSTFTPAVAQQRGNLDFLLGRSTGIPCGLLTRIVTTHPGITKCQVLNDVYSANGKVLLVEKGSIIHGEQQSALMQGQTRVFAAWTTLETPNGVTVNIDSLGADPLGGSGHPARVNNHFWKRIGGAVLISMTEESINAYGRRNKSSSNVTFDSTTESVQDIATEVLKNTINIPPTGYVNQGERIMVYVARDIDFSQVYETVSID